jgi:hypothetical protein
MQGDSEPEHHYPPAPLALDTRLSEVRVQPVR